MSWPVNRRQSSPCSGRDFAPTPSPWGYHELADDMERQARAMPGFLGFTTFTADDGSESRWSNSTASTATLAGVTILNTAPRNDGLRGLYAEYRITVCEVFRSTPSRGEA